MSALTVTAPTPAVMAGTRNRLTTDARQRRTALLASIQEARVAGDAHRVLRLSQKLRKMTAA